jgi:hypothetical protein
MMHDVAFSGFELDLIQLTLAGERHQSSTGDL